MQAALTKRTVLGAARRGKHLWLVLDRRPWPCFHLGMTGDFRVRDEAPMRLASSPSVEDSVWPPRFTKLHLFLDDGRELVMTNKRRLGRIRLREDPLTEPPICDLGFDPLLDLPSTAEFVRLLSRRSGVVKAVLLDQTFAAGIGNWIADEVLYQARLDPRRRANELSAIEMRRLRAKIKHVIERAVEVDADKDRFPRSWLFHRRWGRDPKALTAAGLPIAHLTIGGRTTAWVPARQK